MSYTCPDCEDGILEAKVREIPLELKDGETAQILGEVVLVTSVGCSNGCSAESEEEEEETGEVCGHNGCARPKGHDGNHRKPNKKKD